MIYEKAIETRVYETKSIVQTTNCINKIMGHHYAVVSKEEAIEIRKQHPTWIVCLWKCIYCNKITQST